MQIKKKKHSTQGDVREFIEQSFILQTIVLLNLKIMLLLCLLFIIIRYQH